MAVPSSGELKLWNDIWNNELGAEKGENSLHSASVYAGFTTPDAMSDFYGWSDVEVPSVSTQNITSVSTNSMTLRGNISATGNEDPSRGFYHGTNSSAATNNTKYTLAGTQGTGTFSCVRNVSQATTYYAWAFACNSAGEAVGGRVQAQTPFAPSVSTLFCGRAFHRDSTSMNFFTDYLNPLSGTYSNYNSTSSTNRYSDNLSLITNARNRKRSQVNQGGDSNNYIKVFKGSFGSPSASVNGPSGGPTCINTAGTYCIIAYYPFYIGSSSTTACGINLCYNYSDIRLKTNINYL